MKASKSIIQRERWAVPWYTYIDLNAGEGFYLDGGGLLAAGSPIIALTTARNLKLPLRAIFYEEDSLTYQTLQHALTSFLGVPASPNHWHILHAPDYEEDIVLCHDDTTIVVPQLLESLSHNTPQFQRQYFGSIYSDPNGTVPFDLLRATADALPRCDILIHAGGTWHKRQYYSPKNGLKQRFDTLLGTIDKNYWLIRELYGPQHWTFLVGSNWKELPHKLAGQGFHDLKSLEGQSIMRRASQRRQDVDGQGDLFL